MALETLFLSLQVDQEVEIGKLGLLVQRGMGPSCAFRRNWEVDGTFHAESIHFPGLYLSVAEATLSLTRTPEEAAAFTENQMPKEEGSPISIPACFKAPA